MNSRGRAIVFAGDGDFFAEIRKETFPAKAGIQTLERARFSYRITQSRLAFAAPQFNPEFSR